MKIIGQHGRDIGVVADMSADVDSSSEKDAPPFSRDGHAVNAEKDDLLRTALKVRVFCDNASIAGDDSSSSGQVGDQSPTAISVARAVGLIDEQDRAKVVLGRDLKDVESLSSRQADSVREASIFAIVSPKERLSLIAFHQDAGAIVAMTGDGVNDAPALKKADIGVAMGRRGTEVAREAADMILKDDAFGSIVSAVRHGRVIFSNIRRFVVYLMSCNLSEILVVGVASVAQMPLPILPLQILFLNLVTDVFPALALGMGEGDPQVMQRPPRDPEEPVLRRADWQAIAGYGAVIALSVLTAFLIAMKVMEMKIRQAVTVAFLVLAFAQLWQVFNTRARHHAAAK